MKRTALDFIMLGEPWAITPEGFDTVLAVAQRENLDPEALALRMGRPLENTRAITMQGDGVAVVPLSGPIFPKANLFTEISGATSLEEFMQDVMSAEADPSVNGIVLDINSPGGQTTGVHEAMTMIRGLSKPTVAYVGGMAASAAYLLASGTDRIVIDPMSMAGSIGVVLSVPPKKPDGPLEIVSSQSPDKRPDHTTEPGRAVYQSTVDDLAQVFIEAVAENRGKSPAHIASARGGMLVGQKAVAFGLADELGSLDSAISALSKTQPRRKFTMGTQTMDAARLKADHPDVYAIVFEEGMKAGFEAGRTEGLTAGATAERERIKAVESVSMAGHEALIEGFKWDGKTTGPEAAIAIIQAEKMANVKNLANWRADAPKPVSGGKISTADMAREGPAHTHEPESSLPDPTEIYRQRAEYQARR